MLLASVCLLAALPLYSSLPYPQHTLLNLKRAAAHAEHAAANIETQSVEISSVGTIQSSNTEEPDSQAHQVVITPAGEEAAGKSEPCKTKIQPAKAAPLFFKVHYRSSTALAESTNADSTQSDTIEDDSQDADVSTIGLEEMEGITCSAKKTVLTERDASIGAGSVSNLRSHEPDCEYDGRFLSKWRLSSGGTASKLEIDYKCCEFGQLGACHEKESDYAVQSDGNLMVLANPYLNVACDASPPQGLTKWKMVDETGKNPKMVFSCCETSGDQKFGDECTDGSTQLAPEDDNIHTLVKHDVECSHGFVLRSWKMVHHEKDFKLDFTCCMIGTQVKLGPVKTCQWVGDPHYSTFDGGKSDPMTPSSGFYWVVKNDHVQIQGYYQGSNARSPMLSRGVAIGGKFLEGNKLIIKFDVNNLKAGNVGKQYRRGGLEKLVLWNGEKVKPGKFMNDEVSVSENGGTITANLPLQVRVKIQRASFYQNQWITMPQMPGSQEGQCGNFNLQRSDDPRSLQNQFQITDDSYNMFKTSYTGNKPPQGDVSLESCPKEVRTEADKICEAKFTEPGPLTAGFRQMCVFDLCNTQGDAEKMEIAGTDGEAEKSTAELMDLARARQYKVLPTSEECPLGYKRAMPKSKAENRAIMEAGAAAAKTSSDIDKLLLGAEKVQRWEWHDGDDDHAYTSICGTHNVNWAPGENKTSLGGLCMKMSDGKWYGCSPADATHQVCEEDKFYGVLAEAGPITARSACGEGKQLAMPKNEMEQKRLHTQLSKMGKTDLMYLGGSYVNGRWEWDDGSPITGCSFEHWADGQPQNEMAEQQQLYLCIQPLTGQWVGCTGYTAKRDVICETAPPEKRCPLSVQNMTELDMAVFPDKRARYQDTCYYMAPGMTDCTAFCLQAFPGSYCSVEGLTRIAKNQHSCKVVTGSFSVNTTNVEYAKSSARVGCSYSETAKNKKVYVECPEDEGECKPTCDAYPMSYNQHRICACEDGSMLSYPEGWELTPGDTVRTTGYMSSEPMTIKLVETDKVEESGYQLAEVPDKDSGVKFDMDPIKQTIKRSYRYKGEWQETPEVSVWPFEGVKEGDTFVVDMKVTGHFYEVFIQGIHVPMLDIPKDALDTQIPDAVEMTGGLAAGGHAALLPEARVDAFAPVSMNSDNGCKDHPFKAAGPLMTWYFFLHMKDASSDSCIRCETKDFNHGTNIYLHKGPEDYLKLTLTIEGNAPRTQTFDHPFTANIEYDVSIHYMKNEKVVELYVNQERIEFLFYESAQDVRMGRGTLGCYGGGEKEVSGQIVEFFAEYVSPDFRTLKANCKTLTCPEPKLKHKLDADERVCEGSICLESKMDYSLCCDKIPKCNPNFKCPQGSLYRLDAGDQYCVDAECKDTNNQHCCDPSNYCSTYDCPKAKGHVPFAETVLCDGQNCTAADESKCCMSVANCSTYDCPDGSILKHKSVNIPCEKLQCQKSDNCCEPLGRCTDFTCPDQYARKPNYESLFCADAACSDTGWSSCCLSNATCETHTCLDTHVLKTNAPTIACPGFSCGEDDHELCCDERAACNTFDEQCQPAWFLVEDALNVMCEGHKCVASDHGTCCTHAGKCTTYECPPGYRHKPSVETILCDDPHCNSTNYHKCCGQDGVCSSYQCPPTYVHKPNATSQHCEDFHCTNSDLPMCCDRAASCTTAACPKEQTPTTNAHELFCEGATCTDVDNNHCCANQGVCTTMTCPAGFLPKHNAEFLLCGAENCDDGDAYACCDEQPKCTSFKCPSSYSHKENALDLRCESWECKESDREICCDKSASCETYNCPSGHAKKPGAREFFCGSKECTDADLGKCCAVDGACLFKQCPLGWLHKPDAHTTLCDDKDCDNTPETKCCDVAGRCNSFTCPDKYVIKFNASHIDCDEWVCTAKDRDMCCDPLMSCSEHTCPEGSVLKAYHADLLCHDRQCDGEDHEMCCISQGHCHSYPCPEHYLHFRHEDLLCADHNCSDTEYTQCCGHEKRCSTYQCPSGFLHKDNSMNLDCAGFTCNDKDRDTCCDSDASCIGYDCQVGLVIKALAGNLTCESATCNADDRLTCCTHEGKCDSMTCPPGFQHRHDANDLFCVDTICVETDFHICCVEEGHCHTLTCPEDYVHRINASDTFCEDWRCGESDRDRCCDHRAYCHEDICPVHAVHVWNAEDVLCENRTCLPHDNNTCCTQEGRCSSETCPPGYAHRKNAGDIWCEDQNCTTTSFHVCCAEEDKCHTYSCPDEYLHLPDAENRHCQGFLCDDTDRDTCCSHRAWCNEYACDHGYVLKPDASGKLCVNSTCAEIDRDTCCDAEGSCLSKICPSTHLHHLNASSILCTDKLCLNTDVDTCCALRAPCTSHQCAKGWSPKTSRDPLYCKGFECMEHGAPSQIDTELCCDPVVPCTNYVPPQGYFLKHNAKDLRCGSSNCSDADLHTCAAEAGVCSAYHCPGSFVPRHDARHIECEDLDCNATDYILCCAEEDNCHSYTCSANHVHREFSEDINCAGEKCSDGDDHTCCQEAMTCNTMICEEPLAHREEPERIHCSQKGVETLTCTDKDTTACCVEEGTCSNYPCPTGYLHRHNAHDIFCDEENCNSTDYTKCCAEEGVCPTYHCPGSFVHKEESDEIHCRDTLCTDADKYLCCDKPGFCRFFACPDGFEWVDDFFDKTCKGVCNVENDTKTCCVESSNDVGQAGETSDTVTREQVTTTTVDVAGTSKPLDEEIGNGADRDFHGLALVISLLGCFLRSACER